MQSISHSLKALIGAFVSLALVGWMVGSLEWSTVGGYLAGMHWWPWAVALVILAIHFVLRAWRWSWLFPGNPSERPYMILTDTIMIGNLASYILPFRAGEFIRPAAYALLTKTDFASAFTTVVVERLFDLTAVLISLAIVVAIIPNIPTIILTSALGLGGLAIALSVFIGIGIWWPDIARRIVKWGCDLLPVKLNTNLSPKILEINEQILEGVSALREPRRLVIVALQTTLVWLTAYSQFWICLHAFDIPSSSFLMAVTVAVVLALGVAAPSAPGFVGVYEGSCLAGFALLGVSEEIAIAYAITTHALQYIVVIGYGAFALFKRDLKLADFRQRNRHTPC